MEKKCDIGSGTEAGACGYKQGSLPECAPLAVAYVPAQPGSQPAYDPEDALKRGTLFPGLDLPFMNMVKVMHSQRREGNGHGSLTPYGFSNKNKREALTRVHPIPDCICLFSAYNGKKPVCPTGRYSVYLP